MSRGGFRLKQGASIRLISITIKNNIQLHLRRGFTPRGSSDRVAMRGRRWWAIKGRGRCGNGCGNVQNGAQSLFTTVLCVHEEKDPLEENGT